MEPLNIIWWYELNGEHKGPVKEEDIVKKEKKHLRVTTIESVNEKEGTVIKTHYTMKRDIEFKETRKRENNREENRLYDCSTTSLDNIDR